MELPNWWEKKTMPNRVDMYRTPKICATRPEVRGTVPSHKTPMVDANTSTVSSVTGSMRNTATSTARRK